MFFDEKIEVRTTTDMAQDIDRAIRNCKQRNFETRSQFGRSAIMHFLNYLKEQGELK